MRYTEGRAWLSQCPKASCESPVIEAHVDGLKLLLSTKAVPVRDALVLSKYAQVVINVWKDHTQLTAVAWFTDQATVFKGHTYIRHICGARP